MSRGTQNLQSEPSSDWLQNKIKELRRLLLEIESWPKTGDQLISDLSHYRTSPLTTSSEEDYEMLSIVVNDALMGIDVMKKYPAFYSQMLVDEELRTAFLDTLDLLEHSRAGDLPDYDGPETINLDFLHQVMSRPIIRRSPKDKLELIWQRTVDQLQNLFYIASMQPEEVYRSSDLFLDSSPINILHSQVEIDDQELDIRLDVLHTITNLDNFELMMTIFSSEEMARRFRVTIDWGTYQESVLVNKYGLAKFPPVETNQIFTPTGELMHGLELRLEQVN